MPPHSRAATDAVESGDAGEALHRALELADRMRSAQSELLTRLRSGQESLSDVLGSDDPLIGRIKIVTVLENLPDLGKVAARRVMADIGISDFCKVRELDESQRYALRGRLIR